MNKLLQNKRPGFTLTEILITLVIIGLIAALVIPRIWGMVFKAGKAEGLTNLGAIRSAQLLLHQSIGRFKLAEDLSAIQSELSLLIGSKFYEYQVVEASEEDFLALAIPNWPYGQWLEELAINKDGFVTSPSIYGGSRPGRTGGGSTGGTGGGSGGGTGGGTGGGGGGGGTIGTPGIPTGGNPTFNYIPETIVSYFVKAPVNLQLTANNGWLVLGFSPYIDVDGYRIEVAEEINGVLQSWNPVHELFENGGTFSDAGWEDQVTNVEDDRANGIERRYCYRVTAIATAPNGQKLESPPSETVCGQASATAGAGAKIEAGRTELSSLPDYASGDNPETGYRVGVPNGAYEAQFLLDNQVPILIGTSPGENGALAYVNPYTGALVLDVAYLDAPDQVIATILAHEALHSIWGQDYQRLDDNQPLELGVPNPSGTDRSPNSIDQEYRAFTLAAQAWFHLRNELSPAEIAEWGEDFDSWTALVLNSDGTLKPEDEAKEEVRNRYEKLVALGWEY